MKSIILSYIVYFYKKINVVIFFALLFSILSLITSFLVTPIFNVSVPILVSSGGGLSALGSSTSGLMSALSSSGGNVNDEMEIFNSIDTKKKVFSEEAEKINWYKIDQKLRNYISFSSIPLEYPKTKLKLVVTGNSSFDVYFSKRKKAFNKFNPFTSYYKVTSGVVGNLVDVKGLQFIVTKPKLKIGDKFIIEINYKYPKHVYSNLLNKISVSSGGDFSNIMVASCTESDPVKSVELLDAYVEQYLHMRYSKASEDGAETIKLFNKNIIEAKKSIDSLNLRLKDFAFNNDIFRPDEEVSAVIQNLSYALNSRLNKKIKYNMMKNFDYGSNFNSSVAAKEVSQLDKFIKKTKDKLYKEYPLKIARYYDIEANLKAYNEIYKDFMVQKEQAKVTMLKEIGNRWILEKPSYPFFRTKPQRLKSLMMFFVLGTVIGFMYLIVIRINNDKIEFVFDIPVEKIMTLPKNIDFEHVLVNKMKSFTVDNSEIVLVDSEGPDDFVLKLKDIIERNSEKEKSLRIVDNPMYAEINDNLTLIIPICYGTVHKNKLNKICDNIDNDKIVIVYNIDNDYDCKYEKFTIEDMKYL